MPIQVNDNGIIRTLQKVQVNDNGIIRELSKVQANDNGEIREIFGSKPIAVEYTGEADVVIKNSKQGYAILKTSGVFTFTNDAPETADLYVVGAGENYGVNAGNGHGGRVQKYLDVVVPSSFLADIAAPGSRDFNLVGDETTGYSYIKSISGDVLYSNVGAVTAAANEYNPVLDFWGRYWASGGGGDVSNGETNWGNGGSDGTPGRHGRTGSIGGGGGSSPIGGGGGGAGGGAGGRPNGGAGSLSATSGNGANSIGGGGAGGGPIDMSGNATGGGGNGGSGYYDNGNGGAGGGGGGLGGGGAGYTNNASGKGTAGKAAQGGGGTIIIRWGDSPL